MNETVRDQETGIAIRFIRQFDIKADRMPSHFDLWADELTAASWLATQDHRDIPFADKVRTALVFLRQGREPIVDDYGVAYAGG